MPATDEDAGKLYQAMDARQCQWMEIQFLARRMSIFYISILAAAWMPWLK